MLVLKSGNELPSPVIVDITNKLTELFLLREFHSRFLMWTEALWICTPSSRYVYTSLYNTIYCIFKVIIYICTVCAYVIQYVLAGVRQVVVVIIILLSRL